MKILKSEVAAYPSHLVDLIHQFVARYPKLHSSSTSVGRCKMASYELALYLRQRQIRARVIHLQGCKSGLYPNPHKVWAAKPSSKWSHYVVGLGNWSIDMTAKQFDSDLGVPHMERLSVIRNNWRVVEEDDLINDWIKQTVMVR